MKTSWSKVYHFLHLLSACILRESSCSVCSPHTDKQHFFLLPEVCIIARSVGRSWAAVLPQDSKHRQWMQFCYYSEHKGDKFKCMLSPGSYNYNVMWLVVREQSSGVSVNWLLPMKLIEHCAMQTTTANEPNSTREHTSFSIHNWPNCSLLLI